MAATLDAQPGEAMRRPRRAWIAVLLGLSFPSLAFFYLARPLAGACLSGLVLLLTLVVAVLHLPFGPVVAILLGQIAINVGVAVWALRASRREPGRAPGWYGRWYGLVSILLLLELVSPSTWLPRHDQTFSIPSGSMRPTLEPGDYVKVYDLTTSGAGQLRRGDLVVYTLPGGDDQEPYYVKRVVGLPGDLVEMRAGVPWVNGRPLDEAEAGMSTDNDAPGRILAEQSPDGLAYQILKEIHRAPYDTTEPRVVPADHLFTLGDNRDNSLDSRLPRHGFVPLSRVVGRASYLVWSHDLRRVGMSLTPETGRTVSTSRGS